MIREKALLEFLKDAACFLNKSWNLHSTKLQLYGNLLPISQTIQVK